MSTRYGLIGLSILWFCLGLIACDSSSEHAAPDANIMDAGADQMVEVSADADIVSDGAPIPDATVEIPLTPDYSNTHHWLCHPDKQDGPCRENLDLTQVNADGSVEVLPFQAAEAPEVDCFYVYPTCSMDPAPNADMVFGDEEFFITKVQAARLQSQCRMFAPVYRQVTIGGLVSGNPEADRVTPYEDVRDAFRYYLENHNNGRPIILVGHSQGTFVLRQLVAEQIDDSPEIREKIVAAYLLGASIEVPTGEVVGGSFQNMPLCTEAGQTGCVVTYAVYRATDPPEEGALFGRAEGPGMEAGCVHPAAFGGGVAPLQSAYPTGSFGSFDAFVTGNRSAFADAEQQDQITTPFFSVPGLAAAECVTRGAFRYLEVTVNADPEDPRADDIGGDLILPGWGLHLADANVALIDIEEAMALQIERFLEANP